MNTTPSIKRYDVVQAEQAFEIYTRAINAGTYVEYDLVDATGEQLHVSIDTTATAHEDQDIWRLFGQTPDFKTRNVLFERNASGQLIAAQALIITTER